MVTFEVRTGKKNEEALETLVMLFLELSAGFKDGAEFVKIRRDAKIKGSWSCKL